MPTMTRAGVAAGTFGLLVVLASESVRAQPGGAPVVLAPHRAIYEIMLDQARGGSGVSDMSGRMVYELTGSVCEGYTQNMRFVTRMTNQEGAVSLTDMRSSSWEDAIAKTFKFNSTQYRDAKLSETTQGDASRGRKDKVEQRGPTLQIGGTLRRAAGGWAWHPIG